MQTTRRLLAEEAAWRSHAESVLALARAVAAGGAGEAFAADNVAAGDEAADDDADAARLDSEITAMLGHADALLLATAQHIGLDPDAADRAVAVAAGTATVAGLLLAVDTAAGDGFAVDAGPDAAAAELAVFAAIVRGEAGEDLLAADAVEVPAEVTEQLESLESAAGGEIWELAQASVIRLTLHEGVKGLEALLAGHVPELFGAVKATLGRLRDCLKRAAARIIEWFTDRLWSLVPEAARAAVEHALRANLARFLSSAGERIGDALGRVFGRETVERAWQDDAVDEATRNAALAGLDAAVARQLARIGWVTKGREALDTFGGKVVDAAVTAVGNAVPPVRLAYFAALAAVFAFVAYQLWDGIWEIEALAPKPG